MSLRDRDRDRVSVRVVGCGLCLEWEEYVGEVGLVLDVAVGDADGGEEYEEDHGEATALLVVGVIGSGCER